MGFDFTSDIIKAVYYKENSFPAKNLFGNSFYDSVKSFSKFQYPRPLKHLIINNISDYVFANFQSVALADKEDPNLIFSYVFYDVNLNFIEVQFAYTKKNVRNMGFFKEMCRLICLKHEKPVRFTRLLGRNNVFPFFHMNK